MKESELRVLIKEEVQNILNKFSSTELKKKINDVARELVYLTSPISKENKKAAGEYMRLKDDFIDNVFKILKKYNLE